MIAARSVTPSIFCAFCSTRIADSPSSRMMRRERREQLLDDDRRETLERLVEQDDARIEDQRAADREHLLLAAGELVAEIAPALGQPRKQLRRLLASVHGPGAPPR